MCKSLGHSNRFWGYTGKEGGHTIAGRKAWMHEVMEKPHRWINTNYPPDSVILIPIHVNGVTKSWENGVMDQWKRKIIKALVDIIICVHTQMKC